MLFASGCLLVLIAFSLCLFRFYPFTLNIYAWFAPLKVWFRGSSRTLLGSETSKSSRPLAKRPEDGSITHVVPPQFTDTSRYQPHKVLSYFCTVTGAGARIKLLPGGFIDELQDVFTVRRSCTHTNRTLSVKLLPSYSFFSTLFLYKYHYSRNLINNNSLQKNNFQNNF